jgi:hypothetical protein
MYASSEDILNLLRLGVKITSDVIYCIFMNYIYNIKLTVIPSDFQQYNIILTPIHSGAEISPHIRLISALCQTYQIPITYEYLYSMMERLWFTWTNDKSTTSILKDIEFIMQHHDLTNPEHLSDIYSIAILLDINIIHIEKIHIKTLTKCCDKMSYGVSEDFEYHHILRDNLRKALDQYPVEIKYNSALYDPRNFCKTARLSSVITHHIRKFNYDYCHIQNILNDIFYERNDQFISSAHLTNMSDVRLLLNMIPFPVAYLEAWLLQLIHVGASNIVQIFLTFLTENNYWKKFNFYDHVIFYAFDV